MTKENLTAQEREDLDLTLDDLREMAQKFRHVKVAPPTKENDG